MADRFVACNVYEPDIITEIGSVRETTILPMSYQRFTRLRCRSIPCVMECYNYEYIALKKVNVFVSLASVALENTAGLTAFIFIVDSLEACSCQRFL